MQQLWKVGKAEQRGSYDGKGSKQTEILQEVGIDEDQAGKGSDGGQTAQEDGLDLVAQQLVGVVDVFRVGQHMEHVAQRHAQHHTSYA